MDEVEKIILDIVRISKIHNRNEKLAWSEISSYPDFPEDLIEKYKDKVNWDFIFRRKDISKEFKEKHRDLNTLDNRYSMVCYWCDGRNKTLYYRKNRMSIIDIKFERYSCWYCPKCLR